VLRVSHSAVVSAWRRRERELIALGTDLRLVTARAWDEGGRVVPLLPTDDTFVVGAATVGTHPYRFAYDPRPIWRELRRARAVPLDILDVHEEPASLAAFEVYVLARLAGHRPALGLYAAQNITKRFPPPFRWFERFLLRRAAAVHTCNEAAGQVLRGKGFSGTLCNLGLGVDLERFTAPPTASIPDSRDGTDDPPAPGTGPVRVGYVGRLEAHKGVSVLIEAVAATPGVTLEIVGDGPERDALVRLVDRLGLAERVHVTGPVDHDDLPARYRRFDVVVVPSLTTPSWIEQFGRVAVEAMASGVAVVASDSGSLPEVLGDAGVLVPPADVPALAAALARLRDQPDERARLGRAGRERAHRYSWPAIAARQLALYETMRS
jgi:glycosyltransferase involved in cell wall biosynthesis